MSRPVACLAVALLLFASRGTAAEDTPPPPTPLEAAPEPAPVDAPRPAPLPADAGGPAATLLAAEQACAALEYDDCAERAMAVATDPTATDDERTRAHLVAGGAHRVMGRDVEARINFRYILVRDPSFVLPPDTPPKIAQFFELVRQELAADAQVAAATVRGLVIESEPTAAQVTVDGEAAGVTPLRLERAAPGLHAVVVTSGDERVAFEVDVYADGVTTARVVFADEVAVADADAEPVLGDTTFQLVRTGAKVASSPVPVVAGCCLSCLWISAASTVTVPILDLEFDEVPVLAAIVWPVACGLIGVGCLGGLALGGWGAFDVMTLEAPPDDGRAHVVTVVPPAAHGPPRTLSIPAGARDDQAY